MDGWGNTKATIISKRITASIGAPRCLEFFYHMYGADIRQLVVYLVSQEGAKELVWARHGNQGNQWQRGFVNIPYHDFQVVIEATGGRGARDNIAIDDIRIANCAIFSKFIIALLPSIILYPSEPNDLDMI